MGIKLRKKTKKLREAILFYIKKKSFSFKGKSSFEKKNDIKPSGFTNNPKYFGKKPSESSSTEDKKKTFGFKGKKKFKSRNSRPKNFIFKKHSPKRASS